MNARGIPGINIQFPWSEYIVTGRKSIETRNYPIPAHYVGKELIVIETPGKEGDFKRRAIGTVVFGESFEYSDAEHFYSDTPKHLVSEGTPLFAWGQRGIKLKWGWPVLQVRRFQAPKDLPAGFRTGIVFSKEVRFASQF